MPIRVEQDPKREEIWARIFLQGPSGAGKTRGALELASRLMGGDLPVVLGNTEPNRGKLYADRFKLKALIEIGPESYHPEQFIEAIDAAERIAPGGVFVLDSATHEWYGTDGVTQLASRFGDWAKARPLHQRFVDRLQVANMHIIVCCRAKMKYEQVTVDDGRGGQKPAVVSLGVGPMQDADFQYEFSLAGAIDRVSHEVEWSGHVDALEGQTTLLVGEDADQVAKVVSDWLSAGEALPEGATPEAVEELRQSLLAEGITGERIDGGFATARRASRGVLTPDYVAKQLAGSQERIAKKAAAETSTKEPEPAAT